MKKVVSSAIAVAILLVGCGNKTDVNAKNFGAAISQYLDKKGELCLDLAKWPVDVPEWDWDEPKRLPTFSAGKMAALEAVGLAKSEVAEVEGSGTNGKPRGVTFKVKRYTLTDAAKPFEKHKENKYSTISQGEVKETLTNLCWGKKALDKVVKWEGPIKLGDYQEVGVKYLYKIDGMADWAKKPELNAAFPQVGRTIEGAGKEEQKHGLSLTSEGWEARGLDN